MPDVFVATEAGCLTFVESGKSHLELPGRQVGPLVPEPDGTCLSIVDGQEVWRRSVTEAWSQITTIAIPAQSITAVNGAIFVGGQEEAILLRITATGKVERLDGFDKVPGRSEWFAGGPPLGVRSLTAAIDGSVLLAAVHVGGIPRSLDRGKTWTPTIPVMFDVHEIRSHPHLSNLVAAAAAVGLCVSTDGGLNWKVYSKGLAGRTCLAVSVLQNEVLFSVQDGPFAKQSQVWRWRIGSEHIEQLLDGLPAWFDGKVDTCGIACGQGRAAIVDGGGNLWLSARGSEDWKRIAQNVPYALGLAIL